MPLRSCALKILQAHPIYCLNVMVNIKSTSQLTTSGANSWFTIFSGVQKSTFVSNNLHTFLISSSELNLLLLIYHSNDNWRENSVLSHSFSQRSLLSFSNVAPCKAIINCFKALFENWKPIHTHPGHFSTLQYTKKKPTAIKTLIAHLFSFCIYFSSQRRTAKK